MTKETAIIIRKMLVDVKKIKDIVPVEQYLDAVDRVFIYIDGYTQHAQETQDDNGSY